MSQDSLRLTVHIDGGSRGNPGPAAAAYVIRDADDDTVVREAGLYLGKATNNVAEYRALLAALEFAAQLKASQLQIFSDSELLVRQINGQYRVKNAALKEIFDRARDLMNGFALVSVDHIPRKENHHADRLVNQPVRAPFRL